MLIFWNYAAIAQLFEGPGVYNWSGAAGASVLLPEAADPITGTRWGPVIGEAAWPSVTGARWAPVTKGAA